MSAFNEDFDKEIGDDLIDCIQCSVGCFACGKSDPKKTCSRCKIAKYCDKICQKEDWKSGKHKDDCSIYDHNRNHLKEGGPNFSIPLALRSCSWIDEEVLTITMRERCILFLKEVKRSCEGKKALFSGADIGCEASVVDSLGKIRLVIFATLIDGALNRITVGDVVLEVVDEGLEAKQRLYPGYGSGSLSEEAKEKVLKYFIDFAEHAREHGVTIRAITYGRGLMYVTDDKKFQNEVDEAHGQRISWFPDMGYAMDESMQAVMNAVMNAEMST